MANPSETGVPVGIRGVMELGMVVPPAYPDEVAAVAALRQQFEQDGESSFAWGLRSGALKVGTVSCAEFSPTLLCSESCPGCPDSNLLRQEKATQAVARGEKPEKEERAEVEKMISRLAELRRLGVRHVMNIGGTIDKFQGLNDIIRAQLDRGFVVSWFTDGIPQLNEETGKPNALFERNIEEGWLKEVATHVSTDYVYGHGSDEPLDLLGDEVQLPPKKRSW